ncbi:hypothetical protein D1614_18230 [Maribellus luteus]|uniref:Uncharacterized protein n=1 Tax=Maribellus luteus TaxID=2305463 RepID=A0A399STC9_9BACT|nr:hypothetical protein D1614_18230 [Maribellus luteus]
MSPFRGTRNSGGFDDGMTEGVQQSQFAGIEGLSVAVAVYSLSIQLKYSTWEKLEARSSQLAARFAI